MPRSLLGLDEQESPRKHRQSWALDGDGLGPQCAINDEPLLRISLHHQGTLHDPHFVHGNRKHNQKRDRHEHVTGQQRHHEEGRHVGNQPR